MGISLQMYRCRIGCFNSSLQGHNFYSGQTISHDLGPRTKSSIVVILLLYILSNVTIGKTLNSEQVGPQQPTSTLTLPPGIIGSSFSRFGEISNNPHSIHTWLTKKERNFIAKVTHGNKREKGIKILHWNKGPSFLHSKHQEIEAVIETHKPHVLGLSEANLWKTHDPSNSQFKDYELNTCPTADNPDLNVSRVHSHTLTAP